MAHRKPWDAYAERVFFQLEQNAQEIATLKSARTRWPLAVMITILLAAVPAVYGYGVLANKIEDNCDQIEQLEEMPEQMAKIEQKLDDQCVQSKEFRRETREDFKEVLNLLRQMQ